MSRVPYVILTDHWPTIVQESSERGLLVKFYADWCGHCKRIADEWIKLSRMETQAVVAEMNIDQARVYNHAMHIKGLPTIRFLKDGIMYNYTGARNAKAIQDWVRNSEYLVDSKASPTAYDSNTWRTQTTTSTAPIEVINKITELTDENFEQLTQATTGATTGSWLIQFYSVSSQASTAMAREFQRLANIVEPAESDLIIARINAAQNPLTARRFESKNLPNIVLLHKGKYYRYLGDRQAEAMKKWYTLSEFLRSMAFEIPVQTTWLQDTFSSTLGDFNRVLAEAYLLLANWYDPANILFMLSEAPMLTISSLVVATMFGAIVIGVTYASFMECFGSRKRKVD